jgi:glycosyltransferase involved in cell wall biosynthesis
MNNTANTKKTENGHKPKLSNVKGTKLSVILPVYNEAESLPTLLRELTDVLESLSHTYEIVAVNDGSKDRSMKVLRKFARKNESLIVIDFQVNAGQTAALSAGIEQATGDILIPMDSDLENDPHDIQKLLNTLDEGYDVVSGWRKDRWKGSFFTRKLPSKIANFLISHITGVHLHDYGCTLKAYKTEVLKDVKLYGEMHRFIPAYASWRGAKVTEVVVNHRPRKYGKSNYGIGRSFRVLLDLLLIRFLFKYMNRPIHFFGSVGFTALALGGLAGFVSIYLRFAYDMSMISTPLPTLATLLVIVGVQFIGMGILAEMLMRVYYESQGKTPYSVREVIHGDSEKNI